MFGLKTKITKVFQKTILKTFKIKLSNDFAVKSLMETFRVDSYGHCASIKNFDMGYGWIHYGFIRQLKPSRILCIGSRYGYIPAILAQACKDNEKGVVDFVDPGYGPDDKNHWTGASFWKSKKGKSIFHSFGLATFIKSYLMTSKQFTDTNQRVYDYIYIDGDHSYGGALTDYKLFWDKLNKNGFLVFHDISVKGVKPEGVYGVEKLWKEIAKKNSITFPFEGSGLGILQKA